mmetsp:Transcript_78277/g.162594  ORF Transcript_78277/g.162594 Transcript_78277/m.162594 type:complete len:108 (+) Transcript_78277:862-1185(+)
MSVSRSSLVIRPVPSSSHERKACTMLLTCGDKLDVIFNQFLLEASSGALPKLDWLSEQRRKEPLCRSLAAEPCRGRRFGRQLRLRSKAELQAINDACRKCSDDVPFR